MKVRFTDTLLILMLILSEASPFQLWKYRGHRVLRPFSRRYSLLKYPSKPGSDFMSLKKQMNAVYHSRLRQGPHSKIFRDTCRLEPVIMRINPSPPWCRSVMVEAEGCRGGCRSYSQPDPRNLTNIVHSCSCCRPLAHRGARIKLPCRIPKSAVVYSATACQCRPCYTEKGAEEVKTVSDYYKRNFPFSVG